MAVVRPYLSTDQNHVRRTHLDIERNSSARFRQNSSIGFGGDAIKVKIKDGCRRPYLSTDWNQFREDTTRQLVKHLRQVYKKKKKTNPNRWSRRKCDNKIVTVIHDLKVGRRSARIVFGRTHLQGFDKIAQVVSEEMR